jgi:hypothetical protein
MLGYYLVYVLYVPLNEKYLTDGNYSVNSQTLQVVVYTNMCHTKALDFHSFCSFHKYLSAFGM